MCVCACVCVYVYVCVCVCECGPPSKLAKFPLCFAAYVIHETSVRGHGQVFKRDEEERIAEGFRV